jgi:hypothetical protein
MTSNRKAGWNGSGSNRLGVKRNLRKPHSTPLQVYRAPARRGGFPNRSFRDLQKLGPAALETFLDLRQIGASR